MGEATWRLEAEIERLRSVNLDLHQKLRAALRSDSQEREPPPWLRFWLAEWRAKAQGRAAVVVGPIEEAGADDLWKRLRLASTMGERDEPDLRKPPGQRTAGQRSEEHRALSEQLSEEVQDLILRSGCVLTSQDILDRERAAIPEGAVPVEVQGGGTEDWSSNPATVDLPQRLPAGPYWLLPRTPEDAPDAD